MKRRSITRWLQGAGLAGVATSAASLAWAAGGGEAAHGGFTATDAFRVMNFVVLAGVLFFLLRKPIPRALNARIRGIENTLQDLEAKKKEAEGRLAETTRRIRDMEREAERIVAEYRRQGEEARARLLREAEAAAEKLRQQAHRAIEHEFAQARAQLQDEILEKALARAEERLQREMTSKDQAALVEDYLQKVVAL